MIDARSDVDKYRAGCRTLENMIPRIYGPATRRPGTKYIDTCGGEARLIPFIYSNSIAYMCLLEDSVMYFYYNGGRLNDGGGARVSLTTPYAAADLAEIQYKQSNDVLWLIHPDYAPRKLIRTSATTFTLTSIVFNNGPFQKRHDLSHDDGVTLTPSSTFAVADDDISNTASAYFASSEYDDNMDASKAFDDRTTGAGCYWQTAVNSYDDQYVGCQFATGKVIKQVRIAPFATKPSISLFDAWAYNPRYIQIDASNDGVTWTKISINDWGINSSAWNTDGAELDNVTSPGTWAQLKLDNTTAYTYWRVYVHETWGTLVLRINEIEFIANTTTFEDEVTLTASEAIFDAEQVGSLFSLTQQRENTNVSGSSTNPTTGYTDDILVEGAFTFTTHGTWTGTVLLERSINRQVWETFRKWTSDADLNVQYTGQEDQTNVYYRINVESMSANTSPGTGGMASKIKYDISVNSSTQTGICRVIAYNSTTEVEVDILKPFASTDPSERWAEGSWSDYRGWPRTMTFFENRTVYAGNANQLQTVWLSAIDDFENFAVGTNDDESFSLTMSSDTRNAIQWISALDALLVGTAAGEWRIRSSSDDEPLTPSNFSFKQQSSRGSKSLQALPANEAILFVDSVGRKIREVAYDGNRYKFVARDLTALAEHITSGGVTTIALQKNPDPILWSVADNVLLSMTYEREQEVIAWARHPFEGTDATGAITDDVGPNDVAVIPGTNEDEVWLIVGRVIGGSLVRHLDQMQPRSVDDQEDMWFVDGGLDYDSTATTTFSGLDHLEGEEVYILADGAVQPPKTVVNGAITLSESASRVIVGLPFRYTLQPMRFDMEIQGTTKGTLKRFAEVVVSFYRTSNANYGEDVDHLFEIDWRGEEAYGTAPALYTGDKIVAHEGGFSAEDPFIITGNDPLPCTVRAIIPRVNVGGR